MFHPSSKDVELSEEEFRLLRDLIHERFGIYFDEGQRASMRTRLLGRLQSLDLDSFEDYYHHLRFNPQREEELARMITHVTNNETYFYREQPQLTVFSEQILRRLREHKQKTGDRTLRVLSAGCSTGEEPYTLAMLVYDSGQFFWNWEVAVTGLDVDPAALAKAQTATYHHNSFRGVDPGLLDRHFVRQGRETQVKESIRRMVRFRQGNLMVAESYAGLAPLDVIFCRNVLIYFSDATIRNVVGHFWEVLAPGGFLFLGHAESLSRITDRFTPLRFPGAMAYQKPDGGLGAEERPLAT